MKPSPLESTGQRLARLRQQHGYTQQTLADRLAISRVAVSHIEADLSTPSERTITLLAGLFKCTPHELVKGTTYPLAKAERLPYGVAWYTELELEFALLKNDLEWVEKLKDRNLTTDVLKAWQIRLLSWEREYLDAHDQALLAQMREKLRIALEETLS